jgi:hypothetical protein
LGIQQGLKVARHLFLVADIGEDDLILGYPFLENFRPIIDWAKGKLKGSIKAWTVTKSQLRRTMVAQQLAEKVTDKKQKMWEELVPKSYHHFGKVFSEQASERFPGKRRWDHAIDLKPDAPTSLNTRVYPLSPKEKEEQHKFVQANLRLQ